MKHFSIKIYILLLLLLPLLSACGGGSPEISVVDAWVRPDPLMENAAGYMTILNSGRQSDYLIGVKVDFAGMASAHETQIDGDLHKMVPVKRLEIPAGGQVIFQPLSYHVMIMMLKEELTYGEFVTVILEFEKSGEITAQAEVRKE